MKVCVQALMFKCGSINEACALVASHTTGNTLIGLIKMKD